MTYVIGIDVGGTKIHGILIKNGRIIERVYLLHEKKTREAFLETVYNVVCTLRRIAGPNKIFGIGVGVPSGLNAQKTSLLSPPNFPALNGLRLKPWLERRFRVPVKLENDAQCFTLGAWLSRSRGQTKAPPSLVLGVTAGTGLGGGILLNGKVWEGAHGAAAEFGHAVIMPRGDLCACGRRGCLEMYASGKWIRRQSGISAKELAQRAFAGDRKAKKMFESMGYYLGLGIANVMRVLDPDIVLCGGGIMKSARLFMGVARKVARSHVSRRAKRIPIEVAHNLDDAGALGAAMLFSL